MWRCFSNQGHNKHAKPIFSTYVEVFLHRKFGEVSIDYFLHVCGGVSDELDAHKKTMRFSPRMWRCFCLFLLIKSLRIIFSTYVEVFPWAATVAAADAYFLHVCGGVSLLATSAILARSFSPRMWRCFRPHRCSDRKAAIFSTYVEVFLHTLKSGLNRFHFLHVCGGVSSLGCRH